MPAPRPLSTEFLELQQALLGRYSIERELGRGGMGIVLLARDVALDRLVAIKLLPPSLAASAEYRDKFLREARTAAGLSHPNIVPIHLVEAHGNIVFFVMGFVDGESLRSRIERAGPLPPRLAAKYMQDVAWALSYAHQRGVIHRDIKPDNIMIESGEERALVTDFGIAIGGRHGGSATDVAGTARYMSPEQALGEPVDGRSDLYSLGATFFYAITGRAPYDAPSLPAILALQVSRPAPQVHDVRPEVSPRLADVVDRCLLRDPADRLPDAEAVARAIDEARGRSLRAPPLIRSFLRNAQVTTMVMIANAFAGPTVSVGPKGVSVDLAGVIALVLTIQLVAVARRLLREGYTFDHIREALLAEAQVQAEEADAIKQRRWMNRIDSLWHRIWAGKIGRWFFAVAGIRLKVAHRVPAAPSADATEVVLGNLARTVFEQLPAATREQAGDVPAVVQRLERHAERLRARGDTGENLTDTVAALESIRLALVRLDAGLETGEALTDVLMRARKIGEDVDRYLEIGHQSSERVKTPAPSRG